MRLGGNDFNSLGILAVAFAFLLLLSTGAMAQTEYWGPRMLIHEEVEVDYWDNGTEKTSTRPGYFFVSVPNNDDVLQYIQISLDSGFATNTNIDGDVAAYNDVLTSQPSADAWESMYVNTTANDDDTNYLVDNNVDEIAPAIELSMSYSNDEGGTDLYDNENIDVSGAAQPDNTISVTFTMSNPSTSRAIDGVVAYIYMNRNVGTGNSEPEFSVAGQSEGTATAADSDGDGYDDYITWTGVNLGTSESVTATVDINITSGDHIGLSDSVNLDGGTTGPEASDKGMNATAYGTGDLFSGITVSDKFSRGPIRQGVDMSSSAGSWYVRGFIRNMGTDIQGGGEYNLTYNVSAWRIYEVDPSTGSPYSQANQSGEFNQSATSSYIISADGRIYTNNDVRSSNTTLYNKSGTKPYISVYFDWEVVWNYTASENNRTYVNTTMDLPTLYLLDMSAVQSIIGTISPEVGGEDATITLNMTNIGHNNTEPGFVQLLAHVPSNTSDGDFRGSGWAISNPELYLDGKLIDNDTTNCIVSYSDPTESSDGLVNVSIYNLPACDLNEGGTADQTFDENSELVLEYTATSDSAMTTGDSYTMYAEGQMNSSSDTRDKERFNNVSISVAGKRLIGWKQLVADDVNNPTLVNTTMQIQVQDTQLTGISGLKFMDYVPSGFISYTDYVNNVTVKFYNDTGWHDWNYGEDYNITINGTAQLSDGLLVDTFEFVNESDQAGWNLTSTDTIWINYELNYTTPGAYILPVMIAAFDPDTGASLDTAFYGVIKVVIPEPNVPLSIDEGELVQSTTVIVGKSVVWTKDFDVYNPNPRTVNARFETVVFDDATDGYVSYFDDSGRRIEEGIGFAKDGDGNKIMYWDTVMRPLEARSYEVTVLSPPVLELDRDVEVMEQLPEKKVRLKMDIYLKSFAQEDYGNVILNLPITYQNVEEVRDGFGNKMAFTGGLETTSITVDRMEAGELKTITVIYQESYPTIIITPDRDRYNLNSPVSLEVLVINGGEKIEYPYLEVEIYTPGMEVIFSNLEKLEELEPLENNEIYEKFVIPASAPSGNYIISAKFREDFAVLASATGNFYVAGISGGLPEGIEILMIVLICGILGYFSLRRFRELRGGKVYGGGF